MSRSGPFGMDPEDFERAIADASQSLREAFSFANRLLPKPASASASAPEHKTDGVWIIYSLADDGSARVEQVHPDELAALRANKDNTDPPTQSPVPSVWRGDRGVLDAQ